MSCEEEKLKIWSLNIQFLLNGRKFFGQITLYDTALEITGSKLSMNFPLVDVSDVHEETRKGLFKTKKFVVINMKNGNRLEFEAPGDAAPYIDDFNNYIKLALEYPAREQEIQKALNQKPVACELAFDASRLAEKMRRKGKKKENEHVSRLITIYIPFAVCKIQGPLYVQPKTIVVKLAVPKDHISSLSTSLLTTHWFTGSWANPSAIVISLLNMMVPASIGIPKLRRLVLLKSSADGDSKIVVPPNTSAINSINTITSTIREAVNKITEDFQMNYNQLVANYNASPYQGTLNALRDLQSEYNWQITEIKDALSLRFLPGEISKVDVIYTFYHPYLYVEYESDAGSRRTVILDWIGNDATAELSPAIDQILNNGMYNDTIEFYDELIKSLITNGDISGAKRMHDEAMALYPKILKESFDEYLEIARNVNQQSAPQKDYWSVLGLRPGASKEVITAVYKELMKQYHPDLLPEGATPAQRKLIEDKVKEINEAYEALMKE